MSSRGREGAGLPLGPSPDDTPYPIIEIIPRDDMHDEITPPPDSHDMSMAEVAASLRKLHRWASSQGHSTVLDNVTAAQHSFYEVAPMYRYM